jgi:hypothetical protein
MCNRDERRARGVALPPALRRVGERVAAFPLDPVGGGTWVGVNDAGLTIALLNRTTGRSATRHRQSRGAIVRALLAQPSLPAARDAALRLDTATFDPFALVLIQDAHYCAVIEDGQTLRSCCLPLTSPVLFTSSSLGDDVVDRPRRQLFERLVLGATDVPLHGQARFHRHHWPSRPEISVRMTRREAATVSRTVVDVTRHGYSLLYHPLTDGREGPREWCFFR